MAKFSDNNMASIIWDEIIINPGALTAGTATGQVSRIDASRLQGFRVLKTQYFVVCQGMTADEGPVMLFLNHDLSATEQEECLGADPQRSGDPDKESRAMRPVWPLGTFFKDSAGNGQLVLDGEIKLGWSFPEGTDLKWMVQNVGAQTMTTGANYRIIAKHFGVWLRD